MTVTSGSNCSTIFLISSMTSNLTCGSLIKSVNRLVEKFKVASSTPERRLTRSSILFAQLAQSKPNKANLNVLSFSIRTRPQII